MHRIRRIVEWERSKLNELGMHSLTRGVPLSENPEVQAQSCQVDAWTTLYGRLKRCHAYRDVIEKGENIIKIPVWFRQAIQRRLMDVVAQAEVDPMLSQLRGEEEEAFETLYATLSDMGAGTDYAVWEEKHYRYEAAVQELLYLKGLQDGMELASGMLRPAAQTDEDDESSRTETV
ncbi:hypothetical protein [Paenibacillus sp. 598K]|uniref:hypothetical protein n=1 Tax=Paenibacillus sp. 598K TaxID=1117987 RepID=UPI001626C389|nr:hypothetical protein [Paenibacillus sp. 598K]